MSGNLWQRTLVYFGMADDPEDYDDYEDDEVYEEAPERVHSRNRGAEEELGRTYGDRPNVRRLGSRRRTADYDDDPPPSRSRPVRAVDSAPRTSEVALVVPKSFNDAQQIADKYKRAVPVILNLQSSDNDLAKRLIDFASGLTYALDGGMQRVADKVFMLTPRNVEVSAEERARLLEKGFFNQY
jgi:cell division inhibitor SepF